MSDELFDIIHRDCGKVAFRYATRPTPGETIMAARAVLLDGTVPVSGQPMVCGTCKARIYAVASLRIDSA